MSMLSRLRLRTLDWARDSRGSMPVEGVIASTWLIWWYIASFQFFDAYRQKNINLKAEWYGVEQKGRKINNVADEKYNQFVLGAQISF